MYNTNTSKIDAIGGLDYNKCSSILNNRTSKKIANETYIHRLDTMTITIKHYNTNIITFDNEENITIDLNGYRTQTTFYRVSTFLPQLTIYRDKKYGYLIYFKNNREKKYYFNDGIIITSKGEFKNTTEPFLYAIQNKLNGVEFKKYIKNLSYKQYCSIQDKYMDSTPELQQYCNAEVLLQVIKKNNNIPNYSIIKNRSFKGVLPKLSDKDFLHVINSSNCDSNGYHKIPSYINEEQFKVLLKDKCRFDVSLLIEKEFVKSYITQLSNEQFIDLWSNSHNKNGLAEVCSKEQFRYFIFYKTAWDRKTDNTIFNSPITKSCIETLNSKDVLSLAIKTSSEFCFKYCSPQVFINLIKQKHTDILGDILRDGLFLNSFSKEFISKMDIKQFDKLSEIIYDISYIYRYPTIIGDSYNLVNYIVSYCKKEILPLLNLNLIEDFTRKILEKRFVEP